jgi:hypothetical protein
MSQLVETVAVAICAATNGRISKDDADWIACAAVEASRVETIRAELAQAKEREAGLREALAQIVEIGTKEIIERIGDAYDPRGYETYTTVSAAADIARAALAQAAPAGGDL